jgi:GWxTD domain-containing protein
MRRIQRLLGQPARFSPAPALVFLTLAVGAALYAFEPAPVPVPEPIPAPAPEPTPSPAPQQPAPAPRPAPQPQTPAGTQAPSTIAARATPYDRWLEHEVVWIISQDEHDAFRRLQTDQERQMFIAQFWLRRDPTPGTLLNELQEEHYRRIAWSNARFAYPRIEGWMSDRGMIYIKFGPPDEKEEHPANPSQHAYERWRYRHLEGLGNDVVFTFLDQQANQSFRLSMGQTEKIELLDGLGGGWRGLELMKLVFDQQALFRQ